eukprot:GFUD01104661.1.p1 GENE.GFUD01104661.1~~GFUD01104661.1.p1  ORF type:complete len:272 (+),score=36.60 GFUD01104661.1:37-852(+)
MKIAESKLSFFFANHKVIQKVAPKILVLIHGNGAVRARQWSRKIILNSSLEKGSQLPFIKMANDQGYGAIVTNGNQELQRMSPEDHASAVWEKLITGSCCDHVIIIAHSYGGQVTMNLARCFPGDFLHRVKAVYLADSVRYGMTGIPLLDQRLCSISLNYVTSDRDCDTPIEFEDGIKSISSGTTSHEWTSWYSLPSIFGNIRTLDKDLSRETSTASKFDHGEFRDSEFCAAIAAVELNFDKNLHFRKVQKPKERSGRMNLDIKLLLLIVC